MTKTVTHIDCPAEWQSANDWDSHRSLIWLILENNKEGHPFAEFGSGDGSTFLIREYAKHNHIKFESYDNDSEWASHTGTYFVNSYHKLNLLNGYILFIDGKPGEERKDLILANKDKHIIIAHDTEPGANYVYGMADILSTFKYRIDYCPEGKPWTTAVSNFVNIEEWI